VHVEFIVRDPGARLDVALAQAAGISRAIAARAIEQGRVLVDGERARRSLRVQEGMRIAADLPEDAPPPAPEARDDVAIVYEDRWLAVVAKPAGLVVHPAPGHAGGTLVNALLASSSPAGGDPDRPGIVHRLDAGTSGLMIVAKDAEAHARLVKAMKARAVTRIYLALVEGRPDTDTMTIDAPIGRSTRQRKKMTVAGGGRPALTNVTVMERLPTTALLEVRPHTGRTHQIRVHLAAAGHPIAGDPVYGGARALAAALGLQRPFLHAARLSFVHPMTEQPMELEEPLPSDLVAALERARAEGGP